MWSTGFPQAYTPDVCVPLIELCLWMFGDGVRGKYHHPAGSLALVVSPRLVGVSIQVLRQRPSLWSFVLQSESFDQEEHFVDVDNGDESNGSSKREVELQDKEDVVSEEAPVPIMHQSWPAYRIGHREPLFSKAETSSLWELTMVS